ncbi:16S rRNA (cytosine(1402)-N(4))-methyltransferase RsmH [Microscilla marina]|uniref:Ribosomal RNA small subunit methyltransferase H n=1 Tax=Microscilla marina ATCC 23134 TaxID=313606 RepID=A1ZH39_MICM2|nr:16S rRNA (cytosine(1402)-N(4))-methyltransferase RsmH [Microscilla marina]EAY30308.1 S-adenosyl-methyltransferase MraW [Microscilla marina ATCC 23134]
MSKYHQPVMLKECIEGLAINPDGVYVDVTFGGGGHSKAILEQLSEKGKLYAFDQDADAKQEAKEIDHPGFYLIRANFRYLKKYLKMYGVSKVDGILADLGISSHQIDTPERGFSTRFDAYLDMRMSESIEVTAQDVVNEYSESELHKILGMYGELKNAKTVASTIVRARQDAAINTVEELKSAVKRHAPRGREFKFFAQVFQALRIEVNEEIQVLEVMLEQAAEVLKPQGRLVVMSYHSLEDRPVKNYIQKGRFRGEAEKDMFGNVLKPLRAINRKIITAQEEEIALNNRARSAKLRIAEKLF